MPTKKQQRRRKQQEAYALKAGKGELWGNITTKSHWAMKEWK